MNQPAEFAAWVPTVVQRRMKTKEQEPLMEMETQSEAPLASPVAVAVAAVEAAALIV
jgi:hypothetical protein